MMYQVSVTLFDMHDREIEYRQGIASEVPGDYEGLVQTDGSNLVVLPDDFDGFARMATTEYDGGGVGAGQITSTRSYYGSGANEFIETLFYRTYRGHIRGTEQKNGTTSFGPYSVQDVNWEGMVTASAQYTSTGWISSLLAGDGYTNYTANGTDRFNWRITSFNSWGQNYRTMSYPGSEGTNHFEVNNYYNRNGQLVCTGDKFSAHSEYAYDGVGRQYQQRTVKDAPASTTYTSGKFDYAAPAPKPAIGSMPTAGNDGLIEFAHSEMDKSGNAIAQHSFELNHSDTDGIDIDATDSYVRTSVYNWYDDADRLRTSAYWGSGNGSGSTAGSWQYTALPSSFPSEPGSSTAAILVTKYGYDEDTGRQNLVTDGTGTLRNEVKYTYGTHGKLTKTEQSHAGAVGGGTPSVQYAYDAAASDVYSNGLRLQSVTYANGQVIFEDYGSADSMADRLQRIYRIRETNASGTILTEYAYNGLGRPVVSDYPQPDVKLDLYGGESLYRRSLRI